jgi:glycosyltransferase involved in cell wall biosynthesis
MKICLDMRYGVESGGSAYIKNLVPALLDQGRQHRFFAVVNSRQDFPFLERFEDVVRSDGAGNLNYMTWTLSRLPSELRRLGIDLYHGMKNPGPYFNPVRSIHTMHSVLRDKAAGFPATFAARMFIAVYGAPILKKIDRFIAVSGFVRDNLVNAHGVPSEIIDVIPHGVDPRFRRLPEGEIAAALIPLNLRRYVLSVGNVLPVKNHLTAVRAFARLAAQFPDVDHVIAGDLSDPYASRVKAEIARLGLEKRVRLLGMVKADDLVMLLNGAEVLLFPSLTEGFSVAIMEAMACGLPGVISRKGGLAEVEAEVFVDDPFDDAAFAAGVGGLLSDPARRAAASRRALDFAARFTWGKSAESHLASYERAR